jgi:transcription elongation GreA/GreB family factor
MEDLFATLTAMGIEPSRGEGRPNAYTLHRTVPARSQANPDLLQDSPAEAVAGSSSRKEARNGDGGIRVGDRVVVRYLDDGKFMTLTVSKDRDELSNGVIAATSPLGQRLVGANEEDEVDFAAGDRVRRVLIVRRERAAAMH